MLRVLIVDDEPLMLEGLRLMVEWEAHGFEVVGQAQTAKEALRLSRSLSPQLVITDIRMPDMLGTELARQIHKESPETALAFFSGYQDFDFARTAIEIHAAGYLLKPIDPDNVHALLDRVYDMLTKPDDVIIFSHTLRRIACDDVSAQVLLEAESLLQLDTNTPLICAVVENIEGIPLSDFTFEADVRFFYLPKGMVGLCAIQTDIESLRKWKQALEAKCGRSLRMSVGRHGRGGSGFAQSLKDALDALDIMFVYTDGLLIYQPFPEAELRQLMETGLMALIAGLPTQADADAKASLHAIYTLLKENAQSPLAIRLLARQALKQVQLDVKDVANGEFKNICLSESNDPDPIITLFCQAIWDVRMQQAHKENTLPEPVTQALQYIENDFDKDLSLNGIAEALQLNASYLGQLIKQHTGQPFNRHLLLKRLHEAQQLLRQTALPIREIAGRVGFSDENYFSLKFRSEFDLSPRAYRAGDDKA